jgi:hypothetical protein
VRRIGSLDLAFYLLRREMRHWPDLALDEMGTGGSWGGNSDTGEAATVTSGSWATINEDWWYVTVSARAGFEHEREHYQGNGTTLREAVTGLRDELRSRRTDPHRWHIEDWMRESHFVVGCADCEREANEIFHGEVEWVEA